MTNNRRIYKTPVTILLLLALICLDSSAALTSLDQLIAYYDFDATYQDSTANGYDLAVWTGAEQYGVASGYGAGPLAGTDSLYMSAGSGYGLGYRSMADMPKFQAGGNAFSMTTWFRTTGHWQTGAPDDIWRYMAYIGSSSSHEMMIWPHESSGFLRVALWDGTWTWAPEYVLDLPGGTFTHQSWGFLAVTFDNGLATVYGGDIASSELTVISKVMPFASHARPDSSNLMLGASGTDGGNSLFRGQIDEVGLFDTALTAAEVQSIFAGGTVGVRLYDIVENIVAETVTLQGRLSCVSGNDPDACAVAVKVELIQAGQVVRTEFLIPDDSGSFNLSNVPCGTYDIATKTVVSLRKVFTDLVISADPTELGTIVLDRGDLQGDGVIDLRDFAILGNNWLI